MGYGRFWFQGFIYAHRLSYALHNNMAKASMDGLGVMHSCDNPKCVNLAHLFLGTQLDNLRDAKSKGRTCRGERQGRSKLSEADILFIREQAKNRTTTQEQMAKIYNVHVCHISAIVRRVFWKHI